MLIKTVPLSASVPIEHSCIDVPDIESVDFCSGGYWGAEKSEWVCEGWYQ